MNQNLAIRRSVFTDTDAIAALSVKVWQHAYKKILPAHFLQSLSIENRKKIRQAHLANTNPDIAHFVAITAGKIVGYCDVGPSRDANDEDETAELYALYVDPISMRRGIGGRLLTVGSRYLQEHGFRQLVVWTFAKNESGKAFYEKQGFVVSGQTRQTTDHGVTFTEVRFQKML